MHVPIQDGANLFIWIVVILGAFVNALLFMDSIFGKNTIFGKNKKKNTEAKH
ncbi:hypothetical protein [Xanthovirga aplysinae]|uniref:hypothetical protein n=1 Tax=Xanthovirga aplysinae TaxID=2529853 RepID=UPI0012BCE986|nr:hypothetical protein [Xanthovirga aplysinae]